MRAFAIAAITLGALAVQARAQAGTPDPVVGHAPLSPFTGRKVVVLPASYVQQGDSMGWAAQIPDLNAYLRSFDAELEFALKDRHLGKVWVMSSKLPAEYRRNSDYMADPYELAGEWLRYPGPQKKVDYLPDPLATQVRSILSMNEKAEYVLYPVEIRFVASPDGKGGHATLRAVILDPRRNKMDWMGDVYSESMDKLSPGLLTSLAEHLADLFAAP